MNQSQILSQLETKGYAPALINKAYTIMTRPVGNEHTGQVIFKDGTVQTLRSIDAVRAINNEEINMSTYYTKTQLEAMPEKERTALYNEATGSTVARMRNKPKAVDAILAHQAGDDTDVKESQEKDAPAGQPIEASQHNAGAAPKRPREGTASNTIWTLADEMSKTGSTRAEVVAACVAQGINSATAKTQYQRWSKFNESN